MIDTGNICTGDLFGVDYKKKTANFPERLKRQKELFDQMVGPDVSYYFSPDMIVEIENITTSNDDNYTKVDRIRELMSKKEQLEYLSTGLNRAVFIDKTMHTVVKIPFNKSGIEDAQNEYRNQEVLKPFCAKIYSLHRSGLCSVHELARPFISTMFFSQYAAREVWMLLKSCTNAGLILADSGSDAYKNYGTRIHSDPDMKGMVITLDFPFLTKQTVFVCPSCGHKIEHDPGYNSWRCSSCHIEYNVSSISRRLTDEEIIEFNPKSSSNYKEEAKMYQDYVSAQRRLEEAIEEDGEMINIGGRMVPLRYVGMSDEEIEAAKTEEKKGFGSYDTVPAKGAVDPVTLLGLSAETPEFNPAVKGTVITKRVPDADTLIRREQERRERKNNRYHKPSYDPNRKPRNDRRDGDGRNHNVGDRRDGTYIPKKKEADNVPINVKMQETLDMAARFAAMQMLNHGSPIPETSTRDEIAETVYSSSSLDDQLTEAGGETLGNILKNLNIFGDSEPEEEEAVVSESEPEEPEEEVVEEQEESDDYDDYDDSESDGYPDEDDYGDTEEEEKEPEADGDVVMMEIPEEEQEEAVPPETGVDASTNVSDHSGNIYNGF